MKHQIGAELKEDMAGCDIGYYEGRHNTKRWLIDNGDLSRMYDNVKSGEIHLWCDLDDVEKPPPMKKKKEGGSRREDKEARVKKVHQELETKHEDKYTHYQLSLWARMLVNDVHHSYDDPPHNPLITGTSMPKPRKDTLVEAIAGVATAIAKAVSTSPAAPKTPPHVPTAVPNPILTPVRSADIRLKNLEQLKCLQKLLEDNVLTEEEFKEQKTIILRALRQL